MDKTKRVELEKGIEGMLRYMNLELGDAVQFLDDYIYIEFSEPNDKYRITYPPQDIRDGYSVWYFYVYILEQIVRRKYGE